MLARRKLLAAVLLLGFAPIAGCGNAQEPAAIKTSAPPASPTSTRTIAPAPSPDSARIAAQFRGLEQQFRARLGVYAVDTGTGREVAHNDAQLFPFASTFKALLAGAVLRKNGVAGMGKLVKVSKADLEQHSPITAKYVGKSMTLTQLCEATVRYSDNAAANLLLAELGGPKGLEKVMRDVGDNVTRMERDEPALSRWVPGETRDTTTPRAIATDLRAFVLGDVLDPPERAQLTKWLQTNTTGNELIRAGVPKGWMVGDKTGTGSYYGARNDIAVVWPPGREPIVMAIMSNRLTKEAPYDNKLIAAAATVVAKAVS